MLPVSGGGLFIQRKILHCDVHVFLPLGGRGAFLKKIVSCQCDEVFCVSGMFFMQVVGGLF